jgi:hypothetical protein
LTRKIAHQGLSDISQGITLGLFLINNKTGLIMSPSVAGKSGDQSLARGYPEKEKPADRPI